MGAGEDRARGPSPGVRPGALTDLLRRIAGAPEEEQGAAWSATLRPGATVGRFELVRELGRGGFGVVWEAKDRELGRSVAFKAVRAGGKTSLREERLLKEAEAAARLTHPNIVTLFDVGRSEQGPYLVLELLRGQTLRERLGQGALPVQEALRIGVEVAKGVAHAHGQGVIHRDLKPENVFLCEDGQVKVLDFGLAHAFGQRRAEGGTSGYMAPEQAEGGPEDERTDVFALGVVLFEMLSGKVPFADEKALRGTGPAPVLEVPGKPALGELVSRMLAKKAVERPRDGGEVLAALSALEMERVPASVSTRVRTRRWTGPRLVALVSLGTLLGATIAALVVRRAASPGSNEPTPSIAVLPFADMSAGKDQEYFADGVAEEILNALAQVQGLKVIGRTSSFSFKGKNDDLRTIGKKLDVGALLEGSVRKEGSRLRVTAQLVGTADGSHLWSQVFDRELNGVFSVQDEIARAVVAALKVKLLPGKGPRGGEGRTTNPDSYDQYLMGLQFLRQGTLEAARRSRAALEKALALDPGNAPAQAALAEAMVSTYALDMTVTAAEARRSGMAAAEKAIAMAPGLADGYVARGLLRHFEFDWAGAQADLERALALGPNDPRTLTTYGGLLGTLGRVMEGTAVARRAAELDPLSPGAWNVLCGDYLAIGDLSLARSACSRWLEINPDSPYAQFSQSIVHLLARQAAEALTAAQGIADEWLRLRAIALAEHDLGHSVESDRALEALTEKYSHEATCEIAQVHAWRGDGDRAFDWLERSLQARDPCLVSVKVNALWSKVRGDPRWKPFLRKLNLPVN